MDVGDPTFLAIEQIINQLTLVFVIITGLSMGSFVTALLHRLPNNIPFAYAGKKAVRSMCPSCGHTLGRMELIPVLSWVSQGGKCKWCKSPISWQYPAIEMGVLTYTIILYLTQGFDIDDLARFAEVPFAVVVFLLACRRLSWPRRIDFILIFWGALTGIIDYYVDGRGVGACLDVVVPVLICIVHAQNPDDKIRAPFLIGLAALNLVLMLVV